ncbi:MAG: hypothetical protein H3C64_13400, partial [Candidatus Kuenenia stuttgartiensis]|nr:hypothetical protein [Candidatus Kuenenia stuttgartiensis]
MKSLKSRKLTDKTARWMITCSGVATIFVILALFVFIFMEVLPLLKGAKVVKENTFAIRKAAVCIGADEHLEIAYVVYNNGKTEFVSLRDGSIIRKHDLPGIGNAHITSVDKYKDHHVMGMDDGRILTV